MELLEENSTSISADNLTVGVHNITFQVKDNFVLGRLTIHLN